MFRAARSVNPLHSSAAAAEYRNVVLDIVMGYGALLIGALLGIFSSPLATLMREGDDGWRERGWTQAYEPEAACLESDRGRWWIFRSWLLLSSAGFMVVGTGLLWRSLL